MNKLFIIDLMPFLYKGHFVFLKNPRMTASGINTSALLGLVNGLTAILKREKPTHAVLAMDPGGPTFRHEAYAPYKAQRQKMPEDLAASIPYAFELAEHEGLKEGAFSDIEKTDALGRVELVPRHGEHVDAGGIDVDFRLARYLNGVGVESSAVLFAYLGDFSDREHRAGFVVGPHYRNKGFLGAFKFFAQPVEIYPPEAVDAEFDDLVTERLQAAAGLENGGVLNGGCYDFSPATAEIGVASDRRVVGLGRA